MIRIVVFILMFGIGLAVGYWGNSSAAMSVPRALTAGPVVHFHGRFENVHFCEGDDGEILSQGGMLSIRCADRRRTLITAIGPNLSFMHWQIDLGEGWADPIFTETAPSK